MSVTLGIVSYNVRALLASSIESAVAALVEVEGEGRVVVIDNASSDGSAGLVREAFPEVDLVVNAENRGFGAACNQVLARAVDQRDEWVLFLNPDATLAPGALTALRRRLEARPAAALAGPWVAYPDGRPQPTRRRFPTLAALLVESTPLAWRGPRWCALDRYHCVGAPEVAMAVDWLSGACLLGRIAALEEVGGFDETFFMYFEEVDLARRLEAFGWERWYEPAARATHHHSRSADQDVVAKDRHYFRSKYRYVERYWGRNVARAVRAWSGALFALELAAQRRRGDAAAVARYQALVRWHLWSADR